MAKSRDTLDAVFHLVVIDDEWRACRDVPDSACRVEPRNFFTHVASLIGAYFAVRLEEVQEA